MEPPLPFPTSLCHACAARKYVRTASSLFVLCGARPEPPLGKYPRQPVGACPGFSPPVG